VFNAQRLIKRIVIQPSAAFLDKMSQSLTIIFTGLALEAFIGRQLMRRKLPACTERHW
jgi:hypothetical protein